MEPSPRTVAGSPSPPLVLLADDEEAIRIIARRSLEIAGYGVLVAANGNEAVRVYTENRERIGVVVTDMAMPGIDGPQLVAMLVEQNPAVRIVIMSGFRLSEAEGGPSFPPQVVGCLDKPFTAGMLHRAVSGAMASPPPPA